MVGGVVKLDTASDGQPKTAAGAKAGSGNGKIEAALDAGDYRRAVLLCSAEHGAVIGRICMAMLGSQQDAEDVTQETLIDAYDGFGGWRRDGSLRAWLLAIARRKCARLIEKRTRRGAKLRLVHDADKAPTSDDGAERQLMFKQRALKARAALESVRPSEREALLLRYGAGLSFREVGLACGIEEAAARKRVSRAVASLRETLREEGQDR